MALLRMLIRNQGVTAVRQYRQSLLIPRVPSTALLSVGNSGLGSHAVPKQDVTELGKQKGPDVHSDVRSVLHSRLQPELVIFDKDGTLISFHDQWSPWIQAFTQKLERKTGLQLKKAIFESLDFCTFTSKTRSGLLGHGTTWQIKREMEDLLTSLGLQRREAQLSVEACWEDCLQDQESIKTLTHLNKLFAHLRSKGIKIALCTSDSRSSTERTFSKIGVREDIDLVVCGDDAESRPKPHPHNARFICHGLGVNPAKAVLIGDTQVDMRMGQAAGVGLVIGVLSGIGTRLDLAPYADHVVANVDEAVRLINSHPQTSRQPVKQATIKMSDGRKASLVIFDKDGTLLCFNAMWTPWIQDMVTRLEKETGLSLRQRILSELGYCHDTQSWKSGLFAEGTDGQNRDKVKATLIHEGLSEKDAQESIDKAWSFVDHTEETGNLKLLDNPRLLFRMLQQNGIKVAICTADTRTSTQQFVETLGISEYLDMMVCGDDEGAVPKPAPSNAIKICSALDVHPAEAVVVGDTTADLGMGRSAKLGATVGVLSGVGRVSELDPEADHIVPSIKHVISIVLPDDHPAVEKVMNE